MTIDLNLIPQNGFVPEPLFDSHGRITFVLGWGNYLPGIHQLVQGLAMGDSVSSVLLDAGWGARNPDLVIRVPASKLPSSMKVASFVPGKTKIILQGGVPVLVTAVQDDVITIDANPPLAGSSYLCSITLENVVKRNKPSSPKDDDSTVTTIAAMWKNTNHYQTATFALECFWGAELTFMRTPGVVGTRVGYSQGVTQNPTYEQVCSGQTKHREAVLVVFDERVVSYQTLVRVALERLRELRDPVMDASMRSVADLSGLFHQDEEVDDNRQYQHGVYYHSEDQLQDAKRVLGSQIAKYGIELLQADTFYNAEDQHQQYLYKGRQSARKSCKDKIRCFG